MAIETLLLQLIAILCTSRVCGALLKYLGQPSVVGEMAAGMVLGPVCLGLLWPALHARIFAAGSLAGLSALSTVGLLLFMFVVGLELRAPRGNLAQLRSSTCVASLSIAVPMALGVAISPALHSALAPRGVEFWPFALFVAVALSVTALPVMARVLKDQGMAGTRFGQLSLVSAAVVDVFAWMLLALVVAVVGAGEGLVGLLETLVGAVLVVAFVYLVLKPTFAWVLRTHAPDGKPNAAVMSSLIIGLFVCAVLTEAIHLHAVFGAFLFGTCLPRDDRLLGWLSRRIEPISIAVLMPLFFALAGLGTTPEAFSGTGIGLTLLVLFVAVAGKVGGGAVGARLAGYSWRDSLATGSLMNARGLMELVVIKVGLDAGVIGPELYTMLLVMALATTAMTAPLVNLTQRGSREPVAADEARPSA